MLTILLAGFLPIAALGEALRQLPPPALEQRLQAIDDELSQLATYSLRTGVGANGYRSEAHHAANTPEWVQVNLEQEALIDTVVLVPTLWRDSENGFRAEGFPVSFRIVAGVAGQKKGSVLASFTEQDGLLPRMAPVVVPVPRTRVAWVRIEADRLSARGGDDQFILQLSELMVFSGAENCALRCPVQAPGKEDDWVGNWAWQYLTDGSVPYLMDAATGQKSVAFLGEGETDAPDVLTVDIGTVQTVSHINLHALDQGDTAPQAFSSDFALPRHLQIEGASQADFSDARLLTEYRCQSLYDASPVISLRVPPTLCRFIRLTIVDPYIHDIGRARLYRTGFAEIEVISDGENVARDMPATTTLAMYDDRSLSHLTDGRNFYGAILPIRDWMGQLARRHALETERPLVAAELNQRYLRQKENLRRLGALAALLAFTAIVIFLVDRIIRQRAVLQLRERIAADLHDELGANIHAIGLLSDMAKKVRHSPTDLVETVDEIRAVTERTSAAARFCTDILTADGMYGNLPEDMRRAAKRILADIRYDISIRGETFLAKLKPRVRTDLFLFYKESLVNISRHSNASEVITRLDAEERRVVLTTTDNGEGTTTVPASLKRRARLLKARVTAETPATGGTRIVLTLKPRRWKLGQ